MNLMTVGTVTLEQGLSLEASKHSASQEILRLLWNPKVHYRVHNSPPLAPILREMHPLYTFQPISLRSIRNTILLSTSRSLPFKFHSQNNVFISHLSHACYISRLSHLSSFDEHSIW
jgi:hypothetical protein